MQSNAQNPMSLVGCFEVLAMILIPVESGA